MKSKVIKGASILAIGALIAKMIGMLYRIPLTNIVGAEGMGLYQMVFPLYSLLITISSGGLPIALSKNISMALQQGDYRYVKKIVKVAFFSLLIFSCIATLLVILLRNVIAHIQGNIKAGIVYLGIAPSLIFVALLSVFRGYFQGKQNMFPSALSQIIEQTFKLICGLYFASRFVNRGVEYGVLGALIGISISELVACLVLFILYLFSKKRLNKTIKTVNNQDFPEKTIKETLYNIYKIAIPVTLGCLVMPTTALIDSALIINLLVERGLNVGIATAQFGILNGPINSIINVPIVVLSSLSVVLLPKLSQVYDEEKISQIVSNFLHLSLLLSLPLTLGLMVYCNEIVAILYSKGLSLQEINMGGNILRIGALSVLYMSFIQISTTVLQVKDKAILPVINLLIGACGKILLTLLLVRFIGIVGGEIASVFCYGLTAIFDIYQMKKIVNIQRTQSFLTIMIFNIAFLVIAISTKVILKIFLSDIFAITLSGAISLLFYILIIVVTKTVDLAKIRLMKMH